MKKRITAMLAILILALQLLQVSDVMAANGVAKVGNLKTGITTTRSTNISWKQLKNVSGYEVCRSDSIDGNYALIKTVTAGNGAFFNVKLNSGTEYHYKVRAFTVVKGTKVYGKYSKALTVATKQTAKQSATTKCRANMRKQAGMKNAWLLTIPKGQNVSILCATKDKTGAQWYKVSYKDNGKKVKGYVKENLLSILK